MLNLIEQGHNVFVKSCFKCASNMNYIRARKNEVIFKLFSLNLIMLLKILKKQRTAKEITSLVRANKQLEKMFSFHLSRFQKNRAKQIK